MASSSHTRPGSVESGANAINDAGLVVGYSFFASGGGRFRAFSAAARRSNGAPTALSPTWAACQAPWKASPPALMTPGTRSDTASSSRRRADPHSAALGA